jgi:hypothetical protein
MFLHAVGPEGLMAYNTMTLGQTNITEHSLKFWTAGYQDTKWNLWKIHF